MSNPFRALERETMKLIKQDGTQIDALRTAGIQKGQVVFFRVDIDFEEGDILERQLPHGRTERYLVEDARYEAGLQAIPAHYVLAVSNLAKPKPITAPRSITYNLYGPNSRVNNQSTDHSHNVVGIDPTDLFKKVEEALSGTVADEAELGELKRQLTEMRAAQGQPTFTTTYVRFMELAADHMTVLAPFLPALAQLLVLSNGGRA